MGRQWKQWQTIFWGSKITTDADCSHEIKRRFLLGRKAMTNLNSILKSRDITLPTKVHLVRALVFPVDSMDVRVGLWRKLSTKELMLLNCGVGEDSWESLRLQGDPNFLLPLSIPFLWGTAMATLGFWGRESIILLYKQPNTKHFRLFRPYRFCQCYSNLCTVKA